MSDAFEKLLRMKLAAEYNAEMEALHKSGKVKWWTRMQPSGFDFSDEWTYQFVWRKLVESERAVSNGRRQP